MIEISPGFDEHTHPRGPNRLPNNRLFIAAAVMSLIAVAIVIVPPALATEPDEDALSQPARLTYLPEEVDTDATLSITEFGATVYDSPPPHEATRTTVAAFVYNDSPTYDATFQYRVTGLDDDGDEVTFDHHLEPEGFDAVGPESKVAIALPGANTDWSVTEFDIELMDVTWRERDAPFSPDVALPTEDIIATVHELTVDDDNRVSARVDVDSEYEYLVRGPLATIVFRDSEGEIVASRHAHPDPIPPGHSQLQGLNLLGVPDIDGIDLDRTEIEIRWRYSE